MPDPRRKSPHEDQFNPRQAKKAGADVAAAQAKVIELIGDGLTVKAAMAKVDRSEETFRWWRKEYADFGVKVDRARAKRKNEFVAPEVGDFASWRKKYLGMDTYRHQYQWVDIIEGREPRDLDESETFWPGRKQRCLINCPPFHAKSMTLTIQYVAYRICQDPNVRIIIISEGRAMAEKMLHGIKEILTHDRYEKLHSDFGPAGGFKTGASRWTNTMIYVGNRDTGEKDPTVEVLGIGGQIYGARADLIIMDDTVTLNKSYTAGQREKMIRYIDQDVSSRLTPQGVLLVVGTRVGHNDVYAALLKRDAEKPDGRRTWSYLAQPAVLEYAESPEDWVTLWPETTGEDGILSPIWDGPALEMRRDEIDPSTWNLVYQQQQVATDAVFPEEAVLGCTYMGNRGPLETRIRERGNDGLYIVAGLDPAAAGYTAMVVLGVDKQTKLRYVLDVVNRKNCTPAVMREYIHTLSSKYRPNEWRIEKNGLQTMISQDPEIRQTISSFGGRVVEHHTGANKWDAQFGVHSMAPLFLGAMQIPARPQILIPLNGTDKAVRAMIDQLITWDPESKGNKTDIVMALWFAELGCRKAVEMGTMQTHIPNKWASKNQLARRRVFTAEELRQEHAYAIAY